MKQTEWSPATSARSRLAGESILGSAILERMATLVYSMGVSLDGFIAGPGGDISWTVPSEELHRFHNRQAEATDLHLCGRRLYETMLVWETWGGDARRGPR